MAPTAERSTPLVPRMPSLARCSSAALAAVVVVAIAASCSRDSTATPTRTRGGADTSKRSAAMQTPMPSGRSAQPYRATSRSAGGRLRGAVEIDGEIPADSTIRPTVDQNVCGTTVALRTIEHNGKRLAGVVVWIEGIREGKPLPLLRRYEVANDDCLLVPRTLATAVGGTVNVHNTDALEHRTRIVRRATGDTLAVVVQHFQGEVVPLDKILDQPGQLELTCDRHPWTHGWIAVFDHPYFDLSSKDGSFAMDSIPPGRYRVVAWHERFGTTADSVTIAEGKEATITITMRAEHP